MAAARAAAAKGVVVWVVAMVAVAVKVEGARAVEAWEVVVMGAEEAGAAG